MMDLYVVVVGSVKNYLDTQAVHGPFIEREAAVFYGEQLCVHMKDATCEVLDLSWAAESLHEGERLYGYALTQEEIATIAGFIQPTSSDIDLDAICGPFDTLREKFPERAFWETVEELGESFYWNAEED